MKDKLLVLGAGVLQMPIIKKAKELGIYTIAADGDSKAPGLSLANEAVVVNIVDKELMLQVARDKGVTGVIHPCSEVSMHVMGYINDMMGLSGISEEIARKATNKALMRKAFEAGNASSPKSFETTTAVEAWNFYQSFTGNGILKPSRNSGSRGIAKIIKDMTYKEFAAAYAISMENSRDNSVLVEDFIEGPEFSIEVLIYNNEINILTITDKKTTETPHFVELGHSQPTQIPAEMQEIVKQTVREGVRALKLNNCAAHAEVKIQDGRVYIMEIGARLGGDFITTDLTPLSTGIDMVAGAVSLALGYEPDLLPKHKAQGSCVRYVTPKSGRITSIVKVHDVPVYVKEYEIYKQVGDIVNKVCSSLDRSGHVITIGKDAKEAVNRAEDMVARTIVTTE